MVHLLKVTMGWPIPGFGDWCMFMLTLSLSTMLDVVVVDEEAIEERILFDTLILLWTDSSMYPSATVEDFHPPWRFKAKMSPPASTSRVAEVLRKQCSVYNCGLERFKNIAISLHISQTY